MTWQKESQEVGHPSGGDATCTFGTMLSQKIDVFFYLHFFLFTDMSYDIRPFFFVNSQYFIWSSQTTCLEYLIINRSAPSKHTIYLFEIPISFSLNSVPLKWILLFPLLFNENV